MTPDVLPKFRIELYANGKFYVEMQVRKKSFFRSEKWAYCIFYRGTDTPYGFYTYDFAIKELLNEIKSRII